MLFFKSVSGKNNHKNFHKSVYIVTHIFPGGWTWGDERSGAGRLQDKEIYVITP